MARMLLLVLTLAAAVALALDAAEPEDAARIARLVEQLGSMKFPEREAAGKRLEALGPAALDALRKAVASEDVEVRRRAGELVARIERRMEVARLLEPMKVRFTCKDMTVREAVAEFSKKTGQPFQFIGDAPALANRKITLDTGETTYWQAFDQLCREARLAEVNEVPVGTAKAKLVPYLNVTDEVGPRPTCYAGAARIRVLPLKSASGPNKQEITITLGVAVESRLALEGVTDVRITKARDSEAQELTPIMDGTLLHAVAHPVYIVNGAARPSAVVGTGDVQAPIKLRAAANPAGQLAELSGVLSARIRTPPEPVMVVDDVLKAVNKPVESKDGGRLTVLEAEQQAGGAVKLRIELQPPVSAGAAAPVKQMQMQAVVIGPGGAVVFTPVHAPQLKLVDTNGKEYPETRMSAHRVSIINNVWIHELTMVFGPQAGQAAPAKLQYVAPRTVTVDIPFYLKDVPLP